MPPDEATSRKNRAERDRAVQTLGERIENDFTYHGPRGDQPERAERIREWAKQFAHLIADTTAPGREQESALAKLEEAVYWTTAAIARENR
jgi:hypothetical protein